MCILGDYDKLFNGKFKDKMPQIMKLGLVWPWMTSSIATLDPTLGWLHGMERLSYNKKIDTKQCVYCLMLTTFMT